ncbi:MAG: response regulator [Clostridia bacterium]|nr:response regulator [Clostridia bacterium]
MVAGLLCVDELGAAKIELSDILKGYKIKILSAKDEIEAVNILQDNKIKINAILWAVNSMDMKEFETIRSMKSKEAYKNIPIVIVSKFTDRKYVIKAIESGACEYIAKPYEEHSAAKKLCRVLGIPFEQGRNMNDDEDIVVFSFEEMLAREVKSARRGKHALSLMAVAIVPASQRESNLNSTEDIINTMQKVISVKLRETDSVFNYGKDMLIILLPFADKEGVSKVEEKIRNAFDTHSMLKQKNSGFGLAAASVTYPDDGKVKEKLLEKLRNDISEAVKAKRADG